MRIALYHNLLSGGAKRSLYELVIRLSTEHRVDVYSLSCASHEFADVRPFVASYKIYDFVPLPLFSSPYGRLNQIIYLIDLQRLKILSRKIARKIDEATYDLAWVNPSQFENSPSVLYYLQTTPSVFYCQEPLRELYEVMPSRPYDEFSTARRRFINRFDPLPPLYRTVLRNTDWRNIHRADRVLVNSEYMREAVQNIYGILPRVNYLGVDEQEFLPIETEKQGFVLSVGSLTPLKGFDFLIQALALIPRDQRPPLVIACNFQNPPERKYLEDLSRKLGVEIRFVENIDNTQLVRLYNEASLTVYASIREPFGLVPLESMACGTPVVVVREGGVQETVLNEHTGLMVDRDPAQFSEAVQRLLSNPSLASSYGKNGRDHVLQKWTWEQARERFETHLWECSGRKGEN